MEGQPILQDWLARLAETSTRSNSDVPNYWSKDARSLISDAEIHDFSFGTGHSIYTDSILPLIEAAEQDVILVTCFWARSATLDALNASLLKLSARGQASGRKIGVRLCFSSSSLTQKLFHPPSIKGRIWEPATWKEKLGLPSREELVGLDMEIKSIFLLPFSVMHPKFVIVDRKQVFLPSCNVSWEDWFEGGVTLTGPVVEQFVNFWARFWRSPVDRMAGVKETIEPVHRQTKPMENGPQALSMRSLDSKFENIPCTFLPSPHHRNPMFAFPPWRDCPSPPPTPLNVFLLSAIGDAKHDIYIQTPNLTAPPVLSALLAALRRGIHVTILTSEKLMILEQIVTAGTTTSRSVRKLLKLHRRMHRQGQTQRQNSGALEAGNATKEVGNLSVSYYQPLPQHSRDRTTPEPVQSHLKLTIIDSEWTVFGSGNLDRASWYTSQELGVAFFSEAFARLVREDIGRLTEKRKKVVYESRSVG